MLAALAAKVHVLSLCLIIWDTKYRHKFMQENYKVLFFLWFSPLSCFSVKNSIIRHAFERIRRWRLKNFISFNLIIQRWITTSGRCYFNSWLPTLVLCIGELTFSISKFQPHLTFFSVEKIKCFDCKLFDSCVNLTIGFPFVCSWWQEWCEWFQFRYQPPWPPVTTHHRLTTHHHHHHDTSPAQPPPPLLRFTKLAVTNIPSGNIRLGNVRCVPHNYLQLPQQ